MLLQLFIARYNTFYPLLQFRLKTFPMRLFQRFRLKVSGVGFPPSDCDLFSFLLNQLPGFEPGWIYVLFIVPVKPEII